MPEPSNQSAFEDAVAIIGITGRFPGADSVDELWRLLEEGRESIDRFSIDELQSAGVSELTLQDPRFVPVGGVLENAEQFDAGFFGYAPREAELMDPQQRLFLECAWEALEAAGYDPKGITQRVGVFGGVGGSTYVLELSERSELFQSMQMLQLGVGTAPDFLTTRVSYKLNLKGPSLTIQTACSTSLVAVHLASQSLLSGECDMAVAGGASVLTPQKAGYLFEEGSILSPDGHCRAFDAAANGTVFGNAVALVVLKRMEDALRDRDTIHAVILGSAVNNDGSDRVGFTAPGVEGQAEVIAEAWNMAGVTAENVTFVEGHGTGTTIGDAIEIKALQLALRGRRTPCPLGALKTNVGHLNATAGVAGLIKCVLALKNRFLPRTLHFCIPNPALDDDGPLFVPREALSLSGTTPLVAGVSSFGFGGTNAHVVLQEAPRLEPVPATGSWQLLCLSARTDRAVAESARALAKHVELPQAPQLEDTAYTLQLGRHEFLRRGFVVTQQSTAADKLRRFATETPFHEALPLAGKGLAFVFPGQGAQRLGMGNHLYAHEPLFRDEVDHCLDLLDTTARGDLHALAFSASKELAEDALDATALAQPALFVIEYSLARLLMSLGLKPAALLGHSIGEYVAACLAGVFSLEDALMLVFLRGRLMQSCPPGSMLAVALTPGELLPLLGSDVDLAAVNARDLCVVSGQAGAIEQLSGSLGKRGVVTKRLRTSHGFHSSLMEQCLEPFATAVAEVKLNPPQIPVASNSTGTWLTAEQASSPVYWAEHLRKAVRFSDGLQALLERDPGLIVEVGPGETLSKIIRHQLPNSPGILVASTLPGSPNGLPEQAQFLQCLGRLWAQGAKLDWHALHPVRRRRVVLPTYPFDRQRYDLSGRPARGRARPQKAHDISRWFYLPGWQRLPMPAIGDPHRADGECWIVFTDAHGLGTAITQRLTALGHQVVEVVPGTQFTRVDATRYEIVPDSYDHCLRLFQELAREGRRPARLVHTWTVTSDARTQSAEGDLDTMLELGFHSLVGVARVYGELWPNSRLDLWVVSNGVFAIGDEVPLPSKSVLLGPCKVLPKEQTFIRVKLIDLPHQCLHPDSLIDSVSRCWMELGTVQDVTAVAHRRGGRWVPRFEQVPISAPADDKLVASKTVLITGGLGGIGHTFAEHLARRGNKLILTGRSEVALSSGPSSDPRSERLLHLHKLGADVLYLPADVTDLRAMEHVYDEGRRRFGVVHGVIHCAGVPGGGLAQLKTRDSIEEVLAPKIRGTLVLDQLCTRAGDLEFFLLCSSAVSTLGAIGQVDYVAANAYLDAFAQYKAGFPGPLTTAIGWGTWQSVGMSVDAVPVHGMQAERDFQLDTGILPSEGVQVLDRLLNSPVPHVVVSPLPLELESHSEEPACSSPNTLVSTSKEERETRPDLTAPHQRPVSQTQRAIAAIWEGVLGIKRLGIKDDFFELGGHSLLAAQLVSRMRESLGIDVPLSSVFEYPTIDGQASIVDASRTTVQETRRIASTPSGPAPLSFAQERLWFLEQLEPNTDTYNEPHARQIRGALDIGALERAIDEIRERHETLRTVFRSGDDGPRQVVVPPQHIPLEITDLTDRPRKLRIDELRRLINQAVEVPFDLTNGPLFRAHLYRLEHDDHVLLMNAHHIVFDEWSVAVLLREIAVLYSAFVEGGHPPLPQLPIQYRDFAVWQRQQIESDPFRRQLDYWRHQLAGVPYLDLPTDRPRPPTQSYDGGSVQFALSRELAEGIQTLSRSEGVTPFMTLLACFKVLLSRLSDQTDIAVGSPVANRNRIELEPLIGFFVNMIVLRTDLSGEPTFRRLLKRVRATCVAAYEHQEFPFERLLQGLQPTRDLSRHPLFQVAFDLQANERDISPNPLHFEPFLFRRETPKFDLVFRLRITDAGISGTLVYKDDLFTEDTARRMLGCFETIVAAVMDGADARIGQLPLLSSDERQQILTRWNDTTHERGKISCLHELFEAQVQADPDAVAVVTESERLSYAEVDLSANRLADLLRDRGVGRNDLVAVWMRRSAHLIPMVQGILKAGAAYVPLLPEWPNERVRRILASADAGTVVVDTGQLSRIHEIGWSLPRLTNVVCRDLMEEEPAREPFDQNALSELWDHVSERAQDWVQATGAVSSFTGQDMSRAEVEHYRNHVLRLAAAELDEESHVLEVGCGSGLMMFALAPKVKRYVGLDPSVVTQERNRQTIDRLGIRNLELQTAFAHEIDGIEDGTLDLVLLASTVQFFPGPFYLRDVLRSALRLLKPGGSLIVADVPDLRQKAELKVELERCIARHAGDASVHAKMTIDDKLYLADEDFLTFGATHGGVAFVTVLDRHDAGFENELRYRFDVVIRKCKTDQDSRAASTQPIRHVWTNWHLERQSTKAPPNSATPDDLAYVIFTSGSTGEPKGVVVSHRAAGNLIDWVNRSFDVGKQDRVIMVSSVCFDLSVYDMFGLLAAGGSVYIATENELTDPERLARVLEAGEVTFWNSAPAVLQQLRPVLLDQDDKQIPDIRLIFLSGDWIPLDLPDRARRVFPNATIVSLGGATETPVWSTYYVIEDVEPHWTSIPYGKPIQNARYYVLDDRLEPCPGGVPGDLYTGGDCLADHYTNDPRLTAERFIPDPFGSQPGGRLYRTGDGGRYLADGNLEFLGRKDEQVKVRGFRIELGEVESAIRVFPGITDTAATVQGDRFGNNRGIWAYCIEAPGFSLREDDLRRFLRERLPDYMIPAAFVKVDRIPLSSNGKVDRRRLAKLEDGRLHRPQSAEAPMGELETQIGTIWREVLNLPTVGRDQSFFEVGGHSLAVVEVFSRLEKMQVGPIRVVDLFAHPTIRSLAEHITRGGSEATEAVVARMTELTEGKDRLEKLRNRSDH